MIEEARFREALLASPDDEELWRAYADWHEERGDPRAELMRAYSDEVLARHWSRWFPNVSPASLLLKWDHGFVRTATLRPEADVAHVLALPSMQWVRALTLERPATLELAHLPLLKALVIRDASLVTAAALQQLPPMRRLTVPLMALSMMRLDAPTLEVLVDDVTPDAMVDVFRPKYPRAKFTPLLPRGVQWRDAPSAAEGPKFAPPNVLEMAPIDTRERGTFSEPDEISFMGFDIELPVEAVLRRCFHCASANVVFVLFERWTVSSAPYERAELYCQRCRHFTAYQTTASR
ncbi:MAG: TIGR02996 domain-containing protein [Archangium sp.]